MKPSLFHYFCDACGAPAIKSDNEKGGLGTWHCSKGCSDRQVTVPRNISGGHESDKRREEPVSVIRHIKVKREKVK